jgi:hypothetical protein
VGASDSFHRIRHFCIGPDRASDLGLRIWKRYGAILFLDFGECLDVILDFDVFCAPAAILVELIMVGHCFFQMLECGVYLLGAVVGICCLCVLDVAISDLHLSSLIGRCTQTNFQSVWCV